MSNYIIPILIVVLLIYSRIKKVNAYDCFIKGSKQSFELVFNIFPYIAAIMISVSLLRLSGITDYIIKIFSPVFNWIGIPTEVTELVLLRPFSGSGSIAILKDIFTNYGVDSYASRCASVIMGSSETLFYVSSIYFSGTSVKKLGCAIPIGLFCSIFGSILACLLCRIM